MTRELQRFRFGGIETSSYKFEMEKNGQGATSWDDLSMTHAIGLFTDELLTVEFRLGSYGAGAAHPNTNTMTLNFLLRPCLQLEFSDLFDPETKFLEVISRYCVTELHNQLPPSLKDSYAGGTDTWIHQGAGPRLNNFEKFLLVEKGLHIFFDPYSVGSYAEGRREVFVPISAVSGFLKQSIIELI